jgi:hypothetical protein
MQYWQMVMAGAEASERLGQARVDESVASTDLGIERSDTDRRG